MESKDLNLILNKKVSKAWRGYGFFISFDFGETTTERGINNVGQTIEMSSPEISLSIEDGWGFVKGGQNIIGTDLSTSSKEQNIELLNRIDQFLEKNFEPNTVTIDKYEKEDAVTTIFFSNGLKLEMNNESSREDDSDNWYILINKKI